MKTVDVTSQTAAIPRKPLRLWPGVVAAVLALVIRFGASVIPEASVIGLFATIGATAAILVWWLFFSRAAWIERVGAVLVTAVAYFAIKPLLDPSITGGLMGRMWGVYAIPTVLPPAFVAWAVATRRLPDGIRRATMVATILLACGAWTLLRTDGVKGESVADLAWRWTKTPEQRLLEQGGDEPAPLPAPSAATAPSTPAPVAPVDVKPSTPPAAAETAPRTPKDEPPKAMVVTRPADWPGFRGSARDGVVRGVSIETDWSRSAPVQLWRRPIGPGWSSFAVDGDRFFTQEQRGEHEIVSCYRVSSGEPVWRHRDAVRFWESNAGAGPRATPTLHGGRVYTLGATGILNALDAATGAVVWTRNAAADTGAPTPGWGFTGSPLVVGNLVIAAASGRLAAYDIATGEPKWTRTTVGGGYSSPHLVTIGGVAQVLLASGGGISSVAPADGALLWQHGGAGTSIVQPALANGDVLVAGGDMMGGTGIHRLAVSRGASGWTVEERWHSRGLKPYFNDFVLHRDHVFGFDGSILASIALQDGERTWKGGRYGQGQMLLLPEQDVLLILSEEGELALVKATPDQFTELARFKAIEGKTWNHPVVAGDILLVRNGEEMAAFRLPSGTS
jgi:outer membrane protein assembly factor BamB